VRERPVWDGTRFDWSVKICIDEARLTERFALQFIERQEKVIFCGPMKCQIVSSASSKSRGLPLRLLGAVQPRRPIPVVRQRKIVVQRKWSGDFNVILNTSISTEGPKGNRPQVRRQPEAEHPKRNTRSGTERLSLNIGTIKPAIRA